MKREIKFREWNGYEMSYEPICSLISSASINERFTDNDIMQFTGLKDKNNTEIYEGDIITSKGDDKPMEVRYNNKYASFCLYRIDWMFAHYFGEAANPSECEIIGNIYENPELITLKGHNNG